MRILCIFRIQTIPLTRDKHIARSKGQTDQQRIEVREPTQRNQLRRRDLQIIGNQQLALLGDGCRLKQSVTCFGRPNENYGDLVGATLLNRIRKWLDQSGKLRVPRNRVDVCWF